MRKRPGNSQINVVRTQFLGEIVVFGAGLCVDDVQGGELTWGGRGDGGLYILWLSLASHPGSLRDIVAVGKIQWFLNIKLRKYTSMRDSSASWYGIVERPHNLPSFRQYISHLVQSPPASPYTLDVLNFIPIIFITIFSPLLFLLQKWYKNLLHFPPYLTISLLSGTLLLNLHQPLATYPHHTHKSQDYSF